MAYTPTLQLDRYLETSHTDEGLSQKRQLTAQKRLELAEARTYAAELNAPLVSRSHVPGVRF